MEADPCLWSPVLNLGWSGPVSPPRDADSGGSTPHQVPSRRMTAAMIAISLGSAVFAGISATAAVVSSLNSHRSARNAAAQVHHARTPSWKPSFDPSGDVLSLRLHSNHPLENITATIVEGAGISFSTSQEGVDPAATSPVLQATDGPLQPAETAKWRLLLDQRRDRMLHLRVRGTASNGECWDVPVEIEIPYGGRLLV